jgi:hypothetical protein
MDEVFLQAAATLFIRRESGIGLALYVGDGRALAPSEGVELGFLGFPRQGVDKILETICAGYDTICISVLSLVYHNIVLASTRGRGGSTYFCEGGLGGVNFSTAESHAESLSRRMIATAVFLTKGSTTAFWCAMSRPFGYVQTFFKCDFDSQSPSWKSHSIPGPPS